MLRIINSLSARPYYWPVDPAAEFEPGMVAQLTSLGNQIVATVSNGTAPIGIIDDIRTKAIHANSWDEVIIVNAAGVAGPNNTIITPVDIKTELENPNIVPDSFVSDPIKVSLIPRNGVIIIPAGTQLNYDTLGTGTPNAIRTTVRYTYQVPNIIGDDSTMGSGRMTVWYGRFIGETTKFEVNQYYPLNANLFVSEEGLLTTRQIAENYPAVATVVAPPNALMSSLQFLWR